MAFEIIAYCGRTCDFTVTLYQVDGATPADFITGDTVRVKIGRQNAAAPLLDLSSDGATANGSSVTASNGSDVVQLRLAQADTASALPGAYEIEITVVDNNDTKVNGAPPIKSAAWGTVHLIGSLGGGVGL